MSDRDHGGGTLRRVYRRFRRVDVGFSAAGIAYYLLVSLVPLTVVGVALAQQYAGEAFVSRALDAAGGLLSGTGEEFVREALQSSEGAVGATLSGGAVLLWSWVRLFHGIDTAFDRVYGTEQTGSLIGHLRDALVVLPMVVLALAVTVGAGVAIRVVALPYAELLGAALLFAGLVVVLLPIYVVLPEIDQSVRGALPGAVVAAGSWLALQQLFRLYAVYGGYSPVYGLLGGALLLVFWLYLGAATLLAGAVVNAVLAVR